MIIAEVVGNVTSPVQMDFLAGRTCTAITGGKDNGVAQRTPERIPLQGAVRTAAQQEIPGLF